MQWRVAHLLLEEHGLAYRNILHEFLARCISVRWWRWGWIKAWIRFTVLWVQSLLWKNKTKQKTKSFSIVTSLGVVFSLQNVFLINAEYPATELTDLHTCFVAAGHFLQPSVNSWKQKQIEARSFCPLIKAAELAEISWSARRNGRTCSTSVTGHFSLALRSFRIYNPAHLHPTTHPPLQGWLIIIYLFFVVCPVLFIYLLGY